jgi:hypothetical protein
MEGIRTQPDPLASGALTAERGCRMPGSDAGVERQ